MLTYGPKHLKTWYVNDEPGQPAVWIGTNAQFDRHGIASIKCAAWVPAMHRGRAPGDSCIATGFADGGIGIWTPPYPTRAGKAYCLTKVYQAHGPGKALGTNQDGETVYAGCAVVQLRRDGTLISGGGDGVIKTWRLEAPTAKTESGMPKRGTVLRAVRACEVGGSGRCGCRGAERTLKVPGIEESSEGAPILSGMACLMEEGREIIVAGTNQQDIWEVEGDGDAQVRGWVRLQR